MVSWKISSGVKVIFCVITTFQNITSIYISSQMRLLLVLVIILVQPVGWTLRKVLKGISKTILHANARLCPDSDHSNCWSYFKKNRAPKIGTSDCVSNPCTATCCFVLLAFFIPPTTIGRQGSLLLMGLERSWAFTPVLRQESKVVCPTGRNSRSPNSSYDSAVNTFF